MTRGNADDERVTVRVPAELPVLNRTASRIILAILVELTEIEVLDRAVEGDERDG